ncbi:MAG: hypothetical protein M1828_002691 [Chrysothrix sp. TS-e1954]|nr:MAG: hypothetical protein M1828_002691 [Chrysothrix sp. TS-e1954]
MSSESPMTTGGQRTLAGALSQIGLAARHQPGRQTHPNNNEVASVSSRFGSLGSSNGQAGTPVGYSTFGSTTSNAPRRSLLAQPTLFGVSANDATLIAVEDFFQKCAQTPLQAQDDINKGMFNIYRTATWWNICQHTVSSMQQRYRELQTERDDLQQQLARRGPLNQSTVASTPPVPSSLQASAACKTQVSESRDVSQLQVQVDALELKTAEALAQAHESQKARLRHHSEASSTPLKAHRITFPAPSSFSEGEPTEYRVWRQQVSNKLDSDNDLFPSEDFKLKYVFAYLLGASAKGVVLQLHRTIHNVDELLAWMDKRWIGGDKENARYNYDKMMKEADPGASPDLAYQLESLAAIAEVSVEQQRQDLEGMLDTSSSRHSVHVPRGS